MGSATNTIFSIWKKGLGDFSTTRSRPIAATKAPVRMPGLFA
jgi:hypothetical protein